MNVAPKKHFGQHFLKDPEIAGRIVNFLSGDVKDVLEIGPGMGILSDHLFQRKDFHVKLIDIDKESIDYLHKKYPFEMDRIIEGDFLNSRLDQLFKDQFAVIGNFPYNISTQILFRILDYRHLIPEVVGMFQKEVAERIAGTPGGREYGILSVFMQAYYSVELVMILNENDFNPPPKVKSAVLKMVRKENFTLGCDEQAFRRVVKAAFNQRRKTLRNALMSLATKEKVDQLPFTSLRAEALGWQQFVELTNAVEALKS